MLIHPLVERLRGLGLTAMADAFAEMQRNSAADDLSREDWLGLLIDREATARESKRLQRRLSQARLRQNASLRTPICARRVGSTGGCSRSSPRAAGSRTASIP